MIVFEGQRGLLFENGRLVRWLEPGRYLGFGLVRRRRFEVLDVTLPSLPHRPELERVLPPGAAEVLEVGPEELAIVSKDGLERQCLGPGRYLLWQLTGAVSAQLFDARGPLVAVPSRLHHLVPAELGRAIVVRPFEAALLYDGDRLAQVLGPGRHLAAALGRALDVVVLDLRERSLEICGQEVATADKVSLRMNVIVRYAVVDPVRATEATDGLEAALYAEVQLAVRQHVASATLDALLERRTEVGRALLDALAEAAGAFGVRLRRVDLKDLVLPGEMRAILNRVIEATKEAEATAILRREETAATRSQANTARMVAENPTLLRLKELEVLREVAGKVRTLNLIAPGLPTLGAG